ncbi:MAG: FAD binding domain-containing protein [Treponema sp.]|jgi:CO/xanthine dehydrogenase FAD-binding subunit|nr:FAD binding domain-containing protein [Treponema sp.]
MDAPLKQVFFPASFQELFSVWNRYPDAVPFAGGTGLIRSQGRQTFELPPIILCLDKLEELRRIRRSERYLEIGAMVTLNQIIRLGKIVPEILTRCLENIAGVQLRNIATIGGNICSPSRRMDSTAALAALDVQFELRNAQSSRWISASRFFSLPGLTAFKSQELLTRVRIPLDQWDYSAYKKFSGQDASRNAAIFMIKTQKSILTDLRVVYKTSTLLRHKESEALLIGKQLPLSRRNIADFTGQWGNFLSDIGNLDDLSKKELLNFIEFHIHNLAE